MIKMADLKGWLLSIFTVLFTLVLLLCFAYAAKAQTENIACFAVTAYNEFGESGYSEVVCSEPFPFVITSEVVLAWDASSGATGYKIYYKREGQEGWANVGGKDIGDVLTATITACEIFCAQPPTGTTVTPQ